MEAKLRILVLTASFPPFHAGGYELRCKDIVTQLERGGHHIRIITSKVKGRNPVENNVLRVFHEIHSYTPLVKMLYYSYQDIHSLAREIEVFAPDIIYLFHVINFTRFIYPFLAQVEVPIVYDEGGRGLAYAWYHHRWFETSPVAHKKLLKLAVRPFVERVSKGVLKANWAWPQNISAYFNNKNAFEEAKACNVPLKRLQIIFPSVDLEIFRTENRQQLSNPIKILVPGRIEEQKGIHDAIDWHHKLKKDGICAKMLIVGKKTDEKYFQELLSRIDQKTDNVVLLSQVDHHEMAALYREYDVCFFPSYHTTGYSRIPLEAMASGCLVISYGGESSREIVCHGETGFLIAPRDWETAQRIIRELTDDPVRYQKILGNALNYVRTNHTFERYNAQIEQFLIEASQPS